MANPLARGLQGKKRSSKKPVDWKALESMSKAGLSSDQIRALGRNLDRKRGVASSKDTSSKYKSNAAAKMQSYAASRKSFQAGKGPGRNPSSGSQSLSGKGKSQSQFNSRNAGGYYRNKLQDPAIKRRFERLVRSGKTPSQAFKKVGGKF